jgi:MFS transporter, PAT family, beta-lactamase induction signal transducer AmpG
MNENTASMTTRRKLIIIGILYLAQGLPYGLFFATLAIYFRSYGIELKHIGLISLIRLPWSLKAIWAPLVDRFGQRWHWIVSAQFIMLILIIVLANTSITGLPFILWITLILFAFAGATQDIAIDAYSIDILEPHEQGIANGVRNATFRVAAIASGGALIALSGLLDNVFPSLSQTIKALLQNIGISAGNAPGWKLSFYCLGLLIFFIILIESLHKGFHVPKVAPVQEPVKKKFLLSILLSWYYPLKELLSRKYVIPVLFFILLFKFGDQMMALMVPTFWFDRGLSKEEIGLISGTAGVILTIIGSLLGGVLTSRWDVGKALWILGAFQAISNLGYASCAYFNLSRYYIYGASAIESFTAGLGTAAFLAFLMRLCKKQFSATQYAVLSSVFIIGSIIAGWLGGYAAQALGYSSFFTLTFLVSLPAFALLPFVLRNLQVPDTHKPQLAL